MLLRQHFLASSVKSGEERLTDLTQDIGETGNLIEQNPDRAMALKALLLAWEADVEDTESEKLQPRQH